MNNFLCMDIKNILIARIFRHMKISNIPDAMPID